MPKNSSHFIDLAQQIEPLTQKMRLKNKKASDKEALQLCKTNAYL